MYDPNYDPDADVWLSQDESERIEQVRQYHEDAGEPIPEGGAESHAIVHVVVENQLAMGVDPIAQTLARLIRQGLGRHDAIHAIGAVMAEDTLALLRGERDPEQPFGNKLRLRKLTAKGWRKGRY